MQTLHSFSLSADKASGACRTSALAQSQVIPRPDTPGLSSAVPGARPPPAAPTAPKAKPNKSRAQLEGEERKRGPAGRTSMYKVRGKLGAPVLSVLEPGRGVLDREAALLWPG